MTPAARGKQMKLFFTALMMILCLAAMSLNVQAATESDVYAALRNIGVPESYIGQAAGVLAGGRSDGAGVYRGDRYYSYSELVGYIYANSETILEYCGIFADDSTVSQISPATTAAAASTAAAATVTASTYAHTKTGTTVSALSTALTSAAASTSTEALTVSDTASATSAEPVKATDSGSQTTVTTLSEGSATTVSSEISAAELSVPPAEAMATAAAASSEIPVVLIGSIMMIAAIGGICGIVFLIKSQRGIK